MRFSNLFACALVGFVASGCAVKPKPAPSFNENRPITASAYQADEPLIIRPQAPEPTQQWVREQETRPFTRTGLTGRTMYVSSIRDINLGPKEIILTFDDGPAAGKTQNILNTLDQYGIKATFMMVGQMAKANPELARQVALRGHTIGSHSYNHDNLTKQSFASAIDNIRRGERAVRAATGSEVAFFRFPYLSDSSALRSHLASRGTIVLDVDVDSKDYFKVSPAQVAQQTMQRLRARGRGIILLHDLHSRTGSMLPSLLQQLSAEGYKVVNLRPSRGTSDAIAMLDDAPASSIPPIPSVF